MQRYTKSSASRQVVIEPTQGISSTLQTCIIGMVALVLATLLLLGGGTLAGRLSDSQQESSAANGRLVIDRDATYSLNVSSCPGGY